MGKKKVHIFSNVWISYRDFMRCFGRKNSSGQPRSRCSRFGIHIFWILQLKRLEKSRYDQVWQTLKCKSIFMEKRTGQRRERYDGDSLSKLWAEKHNLESLRSNFRYIGFRIQKRAYYYEIVDTSIFKMLPSCISWIINIQ